LGSYRAEGAVSERAQSVRRAPLLPEARSTIRLRIRTRNAKREGQAPPLRAGHDDGTWRGKLFYNGRGKPLPYMYWPIIIKLE